MRNLKRALSLALASVMLLGMMVVGTSAASYPDVDENDNVEAIEVLNAVQVMIGDRGNFRPDAPVNRHEMATIMAKLVLGNETADNYVGTHPFTDVFPWADKYVAACYENGLVSGTSATTFSGNQPLTAVQAAAMMLRALGYKDLSKGATDWRAPVTAMANQIRLFNGVASNPSQQLNRNQVAQLTLNTLKSPVVTLKDNTFDVSNGDGSIVISGGSREYIVRFSQEDYAYAINDTETAGDSASGIQGATIELGEHLYNGKLQLNNVTDDFGRPARKWEFNGKTIGTYVKEELMVKEYVGKVTGKDLYDQLGSTIVNDYDLTVTIDGVNQNSADAADAGVFGRTSMDKNNKAAVGRTGTGTLTQVFVDNRNISAKKAGKLYIAIINTYLAKADQDYDSKKEELSVTIHGAIKMTSNNYVKDSGKSPRVTGGSGATIPAVKLAVEDFPSVANMKKDEFLLVTVAGGDVITVKAPEILSGVTATGFKVNSDIVVDGQKYDFATTAHYKDTDLKKYTGTAGKENLRDITYNVYLDTYGNLVGVEEVNAVKNYIFITGTDQASSNYTNKTAKGLGLFLDGTSEEITYKLDKGAPVGEGLHNTWCTYTKDNSGVYTLRQVAGKLDTANGVDLAQFATNWETTYDNGFTIDSKHISINTNGVTTRDSIIYGKEDSVYMIADLDILTKTTVSGKTIFGAIKGSDTLVVDVKKADLSVWSKASALSNYQALTGGSSVVDPNYSYGTYALYNDNHGIIAAVVVGEDNGTSKSWYWTGDESLLHEDYEDNSSDTRASYVNGEWVWTRQLFDEDGKLVLMTERGDSSSYLENMKTDHWYQIKLDSKGEVYKAYRAPGDTGSSTYEKIFPVAPIVEYTGTTENKTAKNAEIVTDPAKIGEAIENGKDKMLVWCDVIGNKLNANDQGLLYVTTADKTGLLVTKDTQIVLLQYNRNALDTYTEGVGYDYLKGIVTEINSRYKGTYDYQVSAVLNSGVAKSIMISDRNPDWSGNKPATGDGETTFVFGNITLVVPKDKTTGRWAGFTGGNEISFQIVPDIGGATGATYTCDWVIKTEDGGVMGSANDAPLSLADGVYSITTSTSGKYNPNTKYVVTVSDIKANKYTLAVGNTTGVAADKVVVESTESDKASVLSANPGSTIKLELKAGSVNVVNKANIYFTVNGVSNAGTAASGVTVVDGSKNQYYYTATVAADGSVAAANMVSGLVATGPVTVDITKIEEASDAARVTFVLDNASAALGTLSKNSATLTGSALDTNTTKINATSFGGGVTVAFKSNVSAATASYKFKDSALTVDANTISAGVLQATNIDLGTLEAGKEYKVYVTLTPTEYVVPQDSINCTKGTIDSAGLKVAVADSKIDGNANKIVGLSGSNKYLVTINGVSKGYTAASGVVTLVADDFVVPLSAVRAASPENKLTITVEDAFVISGNGVAATVDSTSQSTGTALDLSSSDGGKYSVVTTLESGKGVCESGGWFVTKGSKLKVTVTLTDATALTTGTDTISITAGTGNTVTYEGGGSNITFTGGTAANGDAKTITIEVGADQAIASVTASHA